MVVNVLIIGITFSVFLETGEHLQALEYPVAAISCGLADHLSSQQKAVTYF